MTGIQAARVAADLREQLGENVQLENGHYGEFAVLVDGETVVAGGPLAFLGVLPSVSEVRDAVSAHERRGSGERATTAGAADGESPRVPESGGAPDDAK